MYTGVYTFVGRAVEIVSRYEYIHRRCEPYRCGEPPALTLRITEEDMDFVRPGMPAAAEQPLSEGYLEFYAALTALNRRLPDWNTLLFHASAVAMDGEGYLFTAKSGTGKSTHAQYWLERFGERAVVVNDDTPFLEVGDGTVTVYGSPWCGKHDRNRNMAVPVKAVCLLERSEGNFVRPLTAREAFPVLYRQTCQALDAAGRQKELALLDSLAKSVRLYRLGVNMSPQAAQTAYEGISNGGT